MHCGLCIKEWIYCVSGTGRCITDQCLQWVLCMPFFYSMSGAVRLTVIGWALVWHSSVVIVLWLNWLRNAAPISPIPEVYFSTHMGTVVCWRPAWWQIAVSIAASVVQISNCVFNVYLVVLLGWGGQEASVPCWCMACAAPAGRCPGWPWVIELPIMT